MHAVGRAAFEAREGKKPGRYSFENKPLEAKRVETRERRLAELIAKPAKGEPIKLLDRRPPAAG